MAKLTPRTVWFERVDEKDGPLTAPPRLPLSAQSRKELVLALNERGKADPRVLFERRFDWSLWWVILRFGEVAGRIECIGMEVMGNPDRKDQAVITAVALRRLPFGKLVDRTRREHHEDLQVASGMDPDAGSWSPDVSEEERLRIVAQLRASIRERLDLAERDAATQRKGRPSLYGPEHYAQVAEVYITSWKAGGNPTAEVARHFETTNSSAAKWVARARTMGLLPPTTKGRARGLLLPTSKGRRKIRGGKGTAAGANRPRTRS
jgi:hypothetical protein